MQITIEHRSQTPDYYSNNMTTAVPSTQNKSRNNGAHSKTVKFLYDRKDTNNSLETLSLSTISGKGSPSQTLNATLNRKGSCQITPGNIGDHSKLTSPLKNNLKVQNRKKLGMTTSKKKI